MTRIIAITNQKGGVGKTTTSVNLAASLAATKRRVLLIDMDPQGNCSMGCGVDKDDTELTACEVLLEETTVAEARIHLDDLNFDLVASNNGLTVAEISLINEFGREARLRNALQPVLDDYDYVLIDCPPSLNMLTVNALAAATGVLIPMQCEYYALEGLTGLLNTIEKIRAHVNPDLRIEGLVRTMFDPRSKLVSDVSAQLSRHFGDSLYRTVVPRNVRLAEAPSHGKPVLQYDKASRGAQAHLAMAGEMVRRHAAEDRQNAKRT